MGEEVSIGVGGSPRVKKEEREEKAKKGLIKMDTIKIH